MSQTFDTRFNLFNGLSPDNDTQRATLALELRTAHGFTLIFAVCSLWAESKRQREALIEELSEKHIQQIQLTAETPHLLALIRATIEQPLPDAMFVYGMENWIPDYAPRKTVPFLLNLNASRNNFRKDCPCPLVLWVPEYLYGLIARDAPDFTSVHSGFYYFAALPKEEYELRFALEGMGDSHTYAMSRKEREERRATLSELLARIQSLPVEERDRSAEFRTLSLLADTYQAQGRFLEALQLWNQTLELAILQQNSSGIGFAFNNLGNVYASHGHYEEARDYYVKSLKISRQSHDRIREGSTLNNLGTVYRANGRYDKAISCYEESLKISRQFQNRIKEGLVLNNLGVVYRLQGRNEEAVGCFEESLKISHQFHDRIGEGATLNSLGLLYDSEGRFVEAIGCYEESLKIRREFQDRIGEGQTLNNLGNVHQLQGHFTEALNCYEESLKIKREFHDHIGEGQTLVNIAVLTEAKGDKQAGLSVAREALQVLDKTEDRVSVESVRNMIVDWEAGK